MRFPPPNPEKEGVPMTCALLVVGDTFSVNQAIHSLTELFPKSVDNNDVLFSNL